LPQEKARQITIELGFAQLILTGPNEQRLHIGIVDVAMGVFFNAVDHATLNSVALCVESFATAL
jgi:hypothetical protein